MFAEQGPLVQPILAAAVSASPCLPHAADIDTNPTELASVDFGLLHDYGVLSQGSSVARS